MRQFKIIIISIAVVIIAVIGFFVVREIVSNNLPHTINKLNATLTSNKSSDVEEVVLHNGGMTLTFNKRDETVINDEGQQGTQRVWYIVGEEDVFLNQNVMETLVIMISNLKAKDVIDANPADISKYGFTNESTYVSGTTINGDEFTLTLGDLLVDRDGYYIMVDGDEVIYSVSLYTANSMLVTRGQLLDLGIFPGTLTDVSSFTLIKDGEQMYNLIPDATYLWMVTEPIVFRGYPDKADAMITNTFELMVKEYVDATPDDLSIYGLATPKYELIIVTNGKEVTLLIGSENIRDFTYYAMIKGNEEVFTIDSVSLNFLDTPLVDILWPSPYLPRLELIETIDIFVAGREMLYEKQLVEVTTSEGKKVEIADYSFNGVSINNIDQTATTFGQFYFKVIISPIITDVVITAEIKGEPYADITFNFVDGYSDNIKYYITEYDSTKLYVVKNDEYMGLVTEVAFLDEFNGLAKITDLIISGQIQRDLGLIAPDEESDDD